jgi:glucosamine--fructose-6-phosphate aminotransferase (isomerizing)
MCGIVGAVAQRDVAEILIEGLKRLEYRGYDSAGMAVIDDNGQLNRKRSLGKVAALNQLMSDNALTGRTGIAHTRWATHGRPSEENAHPHISHDELAVVHNGIIENHLALREKLMGLGYEFLSDTDTEVIAHLLHYHFKQHHHLTGAAKAAVDELEGAFAIGIIHHAFPQEMVAIRKGSPLVVGLGINENFIASDPLALHMFAKELIYLQEGDVVLLNKESVTIFDSSGKEVVRESEKVDFNIANVSKSDYRHFMQKEIYEQFDVIADTIQGRLNGNGVFPEIFGSQASQYFDKVDNVHIIACGTSYHAGLIAKYWIENIADVACQVEVASEYRYRHVKVPANTLFVTVSQSGETADTLAALKQAKEANYLGYLAICNVATSTLVRESELAFLTRAGIEIGVASTKAFTTQLCAFLMLALSLKPSIEESERQAIAKALLHVPALVEEVLKLDKDIALMAEQFTEKNHTLFLGRGQCFPVALEGALKLKEISYIHAEAYPAGELKHGPLALVDTDMPVVVIAPKDRWLDKLRSNLQEVHARGGKLFIFTDETTPLIHGDEVTTVILPSMPEIIAPIIYTLPLQLLSYHVAVLKGTDVDQPRNLAKSVTVE